jgi:hypothetical protein
VDSWKAIVSARVLWMNSFSSGQEVLLFHIQQMTIIETILSKKNVVIPAGTISPSSQSEKMAAFRK